MAKEEKKSKAQEIVERGRERRKGTKPNQPGKVMNQVSKARAIQVQPITARKDPELRAKQIKDKKDEKKVRLDKIKAAKEPLARKPKKK